MRQPRPASAGPTPTAFALLFAGAALLAWSGPGTVAANDEPDPLQWIERFEAPDASADEIRLARSHVAKLASGVIEDPATRAACFALAGSWLRKREAGPAGEALQEIMTATSLFPDDPRTPDLLAELARLQTEAGDPYGAHLAYKQLLEDPERASPALLTRAADSAARAGDMAKAFEWSMQVDPAELSTMNAYRLHLARLKSAAALARTDVALESASVLAERDLESLHMDPVALLAAARVHEAAEKSELALAEYELYVNIHPTAQQRPGALLSFGLLLGRAGKIEHAKRVLRWAIDEHPGTEAADFARLELLEVDGRPATGSRIAGYLEAARLASNAHSVAAILDRMLERYLAAGLPFEAFTALAGLAGDGMSNAEAAAAASAKLDAALEPVLRLLASRNDHISVAALGAMGGVLGLQIPRSQRQALQTARKSLGLPRLLFGELAEAIPAATTEMQNQQWFAALGLLEGGLDRDREPWAPDVALARKMMAECYWRLQKDREALDQIEHALESAFDLPTIRSLRVLRADILFGNESLGAACAEYREADELGPTPWVRDQLQRCNATASADGRGQG